MLNELHSTVTTFERDTRMGSLRELQTLSTLPNDYKGENTGADVHVSSDGRFLYSSNRGHDSIACFKIDPRTGQLTFVAHKNRLEGRRRAILRLIRRARFCWWQIKTQTT